MNNEAIGEKACLSGLVFLAVLSIQAMCSGACCAIDDPREIIEKAILAHGGEVPLSKLRAVRIRTKGTGFYDPQLTIPTTGDEIRHFPDRFKSTHVMKMKGGDFKHIVALNKDKVWQSFNGRTKEIPAEDIVALHERLYVNGLEGLLALRGKELRLSITKPVDINDRPAVGIKVSAEGHRDVTLYFDMATWLLVKRESQVVIADRTSVEGVVFLSHADFHGVKHWRRSTIFYDGKKSAEVEVSELTFVDRFEDEEFAEPPSE